MQPIDFAKALGVAVLVLILNLACAFVAVWLYSLFIAPGHPRAFYEAAALWISPWSAHVAGTILFLLAGYLTARRRPRRNPYLFALAFAAIYALIDAASVGFKGVMNLEMALSMLGNLAAALAGAFVAARRSPAA